MWERDMIQISEFSQKILIQEDGMLFLFPRWLPPSFHFRISSGSRSKWRVLRLWVLVNERVFSPPKKGAISQNETMVFQNHQFSRDMLVSGRVKRFFNHNLCHNFIQPCSFSMVAALPY